MSSLRLYARSWDVRLQNQLTEMGPCAFRHTHQENAYALRSAWHIYNPRSMHSCMHPPTQNPEVCVCIPHAQKPAHSLVYMRHQGQLSLKFPAVSLTSGACVLVFRTTRTWDLGQITECLKADQSVCL